MSYKFYNAGELEAEAKILLYKFDPERLYKPKPIDVYEVIEKCLGVEYDWKYITPNQSILGATLFTDGYVWVWPESSFRDGMEPFEIYLSKGSILIDASLTEENNRGRENFTVMHEVFHQVLHKEWFCSEQPDLMHRSHIKTNDKKVLKTPLDFIEYQANRCAAAFLMPMELVENEFKKRTSNRGVNYPLIYDDNVENIIKDMAEVYSVSKMAMFYRLQALRMIKTV